MQPILSCQVVFLQLRGALAGMETIKNQFPLTNSGALNEEAVDYLLIDVGI